MLLCKDLGDAAHSVSLGPHAESEAVIMCLLLLCLILVCLWYYSVSKCLLSGRDESFGHCGLTGFSYVCGSLGKRLVALP